ncbi:MAG: hypothetical protein G01um101466_418 [Parcubacteria group bacterium Gr01-1014_66]|nr:MAG: hypothetical protein G01um101466_418 [Parcubacteria group bacterium Gr01-1014_66]
MENPTVQDIMSRNVISVHPDTSVLEAHELIEKNRIDGVPVVDEENKIVGILTEYDLIVKGSSLHLTTFQSILSELKIHHKEKQLQTDVKELKNLHVKDLMNDDPLTLPGNASFEEVVATFRDHHRVNPIPVIDIQKRVIGVVSRFDVLKLFTMLRT